MRLGVEAMSGASTAAKQRWNRLHYSEIKASLKKELVEHFKAKCKEEGVSIASVLAAMMTDYRGRKKKKKEHNEVDPYATRPKRRKAVSVIASHLDEILQNEIEYRSNMPENLQYSIRAESSDCSIEKLGEALEAIREAY
jgi:hypothetical protein